MIPATKKAKKIANGKTAKKPSAEAIKRQMSSIIAWGAIEILFFLFVTGETISEFLYNNLDSMDIFDALLFEGGYQIFRNHFLFISIVTMIENIITYFTAEDPPEAVNRGDVKAVALTTPRTYAPSDVTCPECGYKQPRGRKICWKCSAQLQSQDDKTPRCPNCNAEITEDMDFCGQCGNRVKEQENVL